jgi:uncharacterized protein
VTMPGAVQMTVANLGLDRASNTPVVILKEQDGERTLPIWIGVPEASAIALELEGEKPERPMTHDLLKQVMVGLGGDLRRITIVGVRDRTFFATLLIYRGEHVFEVDARPSDSIALALRFKAPIFVSEDLLGGGGDEIAGSPPPRPDDAESLKKFLAKLAPQDLGRLQP